MSDMTARLNDASHRRLVMTGVVPDSKISQRQTWMTRKYPSDIPLLHDLNEPHGKKIVTSSFVLWPQDVHIGHKCRTR